MFVSLKEETEMFTVFCILVFQILKFKYFAHLCAAVLTQRYSHAEKLSDVDLVVVNSVCCT